MKKEEFVVKTVHYRVKKTCTVQQEELLEESLEESQEESLEDLHSPGHRK